MSRPLLSYRPSRLTIGLALVSILSACPDSGTVATTDSTGGPTGGDPSGASETAAPPSSSSEGTTAPTTGDETTSPGTTSVPPTSTTGDTTGPGDTTGDPPVDPGWSARDHARVFISGHSLTDNPLADYMLEVAAGLGVDLEYNQQIGIGSPIRVRTLGDSWDNLDWPGYRTGKNREGSDMDVIAELAAPQTLGPGELYDTLVITERHDILGTIQWEDTAGLLRHYHDRLIDGNPAGQTLLYHSWLDIDKAAPEAWITHEKNALVAWECVAAKVNHTLEAEGRPDRLATLPVGAALVRLVEAALADEVAGIGGAVNEKMDQIFSDDVHLTPLGAYYAALVTHAAVFRSSPVGAPVPQGVPAEPVADLQQLAWEFVRAYYTDPASGQHTMEECRAFIADQVCASFWTLLNEPGSIDGCSDHFSDADAEGNPFRWPDPQLMLWPAP
ncbi:hypothetical protein [Nannocystis punicea]|uniref:Uncharacterized protein n=1 Tax=Nannocystis punicea TaxID=2995304 RepID=A0ABY7H746_9BACT|nr:hypothetical protein [Nannocystis poenicansa]WAS94998.1 hypothetical protein O0S08_02450 [Nannocystis poenicansa]